MNLTRTTQLGTLVCAVVIFFLFDWQAFFPLENLQSEQAGIINYRDNHLMLSEFYYLLIYFTCIQPGYIGLSKTLSNVASAVL